MNTISYWLQSCSFEEPVFHEADEVCANNIVPYFEADSTGGLEAFITRTLKLYKEVQYIRDTILGDRLNVNYVSRKEFAINVMTAWQNKYEEYSSIVAAICYDLPLVADKE